MKTLLLALGVAAAAAVVVGTGTAVQAQNYPWCAVYNVGDNAINCGFVSEQQCRATVSGIGGFCSRNTQFQPYAPAASAPYWARGRSDMRDR